MKEFQKNQHLQWIEEAEHKRVSEESVFIQIEGIEYKKVSNEWVYRSDEVSVESVSTHIWGYWITTTTTNIIIIYIYHALIGTLRAHMIQINEKAVFYTHVEQIPAYTICIK